MKTLLLDRANSVSYRRQTLRVGRRRTGLVPCLKAIQMNCANFIGTLFLARDVAHSTRLNTAALPSTRH